MAAVELPLRWATAVQQRGGGSGVGRVARQPARAGSHGAGARTAAGREVVAVGRRKLGLELLPVRRAAGQQRRRAAGHASASADVPPTVSDTKAAFLARFKRPIPSLYNNIIQELIVQQHLTRYNTFYSYNAIFALGFVTIFGQLMDGYPYAADTEKIFRAYIEALGEDPEQYRKDAAQLEEWAQGLSSDTLVKFTERDGPVESLLKEIATKAGGAGGFHYSRFFAIGLFRLLELAGASEPATLEAMCAALKVPKLPVDRDLDTYRGLLGKLMQAKDMLREFTDREAKKKQEREQDKQKVDEDAAKEKAGKAEAKAE